MISKDNFHILKQELIDNVDEIPRKWGKIQQDKWDKLTEPFGIYTYKEYKEKIKHLPPDVQKYGKHRWFVWGNAMCDEYISALNENIELNPNPMDKEWDIKIFDKHIFDMKSTVIPEKLRFDNVDDFMFQIKNPKPLFHNLYVRQSKETRFDYQNRLFIIHHSFITPDNEFMVRIKFDHKVNAFDEYVEKVKRNPKFTQIYYGMEDRYVNADAIFILELPDGSIVYKFIEQE